MIYKTAKIWLFMRLVLKYVLSYIVPQFSLRKEL